MWRCRSFRDIHALYSTSFSFLCFTRPRRVIGSELRHRAHALRRRLIARAPRQQQRPALFTAHSCHPPFRSNIAAPPAAHGRPVSSKSDEAVFFFASIACSRRRGREGVSLLAQVGYGVDCPLVRLRAPVGDAAAARARPPFALCRPSSERFASSVFASAVSQRQRVGGQRNVSARWRGWGAPDAILGLARRPSHLYATEINARAVRQTRAR